MRLELPMLGLLVASAQAFTSDYFFSICNTILLTNDALESCTGDVRDPSELTDEQQICLYGDDDYLKSMYSCISQAAKISEIPTAEQQSWNALEMSIRKYTGEAPKYSLTQMIDIYKVSPCEYTYWEAANLKEGSFTCPEDMLNQRVIKAGIAYSANVYASNAYGVGTVVFIACIILLQSLLNLLKYWAPILYQKFANTRISRFYRQQFSLPALFDGKRAVPVTIPLKYGGWDLSFPPRMHSFLIAGYSIVCFLLLFVRYDFVTSQFSYTTQVEAITKLVGYRSGYFAMYKLPILILFASKNNVLMWATGWGYDIFNHWHRALGRLFLFDIVIHAACFTRWGQWAGVYYLKWKTFPPWIGAQTATLAAGFICLLGNRTIRSKMYDVFRATHIVLALIVMVATYVHISYFQAALIPFYVAMGLWILERIARTFRVFWSGIFAYADISEQEDEVLKINLNFSNRWLPNGGSYIFIHFLRGFECLNPHPFTVVKDAETSRSQLYVKARSGRTKKILDMVRSNEGQMTMPVWLEGPYGHDFDKTHFREVVFVAGGVGITGVYSHLESVCRKKSEQNYYVYWTVPNLDWLKSFDELIAAMEQDERILLVVNVTRSPNDVVEEKKEYDMLEFGRPNIRKIVRGHIRDSIGSTCFFVCGPAPMCDSVRQEVAYNISKTRNYVEFNEECFAM